MLVGPITGPFEADMTLFPFPDGGAHAAQGLMLSTEGGWVYEVPSYKGVDSILELAFTLEARVREPDGSRKSLVVMPTSCPRGGYVWSTDFRLWEAPDATVPARSRC